MASPKIPFKPHAPHKYPGASKNPENMNEQRPILDYADDREEIFAKIESNSRESNNNNNTTECNVGNVWRDSSYEFWKDDPLNGGANSRSQGEDFSFPQGSTNRMAEISEDPPSRLISSSLHKQKASGGGEIALDMELEMEEMKKPRMSSRLESKELRVFFTEHSENPSFSSSPSYSTTSTSDDEEKEKEEEAKKRSSKDLSAASVLRSTTFKRPSVLLRAKSRLVDPPVVSPRCSERRSGMLERKSEPMKSGMLSRLDEDDEDPFLDEDIPQDFKNTKLGALAILQWVSFILILSSLAYSLSSPKLRRKLVWQLHIWKWEVMGLALICGRLLSGWIIRISVFFIERNFLLRKRVLYFVYALRKGVQNCIWLGLVLLTWHYMFDAKVERTTKSNTLVYVTKVLICLIVATVVWLVKTLLLKVLASSFHVSAYFDRIQESLFKQYVIETLSGPPVVEIDNINREEEEDRVFAEVQKLQRNAGAKVSIDLKSSAALRSKSGRLIGGVMRKSGLLGVGKGKRSSGPPAERSPKKDHSGQLDAISISHLHKLNQNNVSAWSMKRLMRIVRYGTLKTLDEQLACENGDDVAAMEIRTECEAKIAAKKIFINVAKPGSKHIYLMDLMRFMKEDEAIKTMSLFEGVDDHNRVGRKCLKNWVVNAFRERRALSLTLNDTKTAVNKLHQMANVIVGLIVLSLWLLILNIATIHFFVLLGSQLLVAVFMFGNTLKMIFEAIIFLFVMHPFDVGDRCEINDVQMFVEEMNILTTVFLRYDNQKITYPNSVLATLPISNLFRSPDMGDAIDFCIHVSTPLEKVATIKERLIGYMVGRKDHWYPTPAVVLRDVDDMNRLKISIWMQHRINFQDMGMRFERRELVIKEMIKILKELDVEYRMLPLDLNVREMPSLSSARLPSNWTACN